jgi:anti-sigma factor RsiW
VQCAESVRTQAYFDGELDAVAATEIERHAEYCAECREQLRELEQLRAALRRDLPYRSTPPALRARILGALAQEHAASAQAEQGAPRQVGIPPGNRSRWGRTARARAPGRAFWWGALAGVGGSAAAAALAFVLLAPPLASMVLDEMVDAHVRALKLGRSIEVVSTDRHTVKPWFAGHADVSPAVVDFEAQGYRLVGGRSDNVDHQRSAVTVYHHGPHVIDVYFWVAARRPMPTTTMRNGYHVACWQVRDLAYCAVSDTAWDELLGLTRLLQDASARDVPT